MESNGERRLLFFIYRRQIWFVCWDVFFIIIYLREEINDLLTKYIFFEKKKKKMRRFNERIFFINI